MLHWLLGRWGSISSPAGRFAAVEVPPVVPYASKSAGTWDTFFCKKSKISSVGKEG